MSSKITSYKRYLENPFLKESIEEISSHIIKRYKMSTNQDKKAVLQAVDPGTGEILGHTTFIRQIEVDEKQFTKVYLSNFSSFWSLKTQAIRVFGYIMTKLIPKQDMFVFLMHECLEYTKYASRSSIFVGLGSLIENKIIARGPSESLYFINPMVAFNGDRVTFAKSYFKKKKLENPNQLTMFNYKKTKDHIDSLVKP